MFIVPSEYVRVFGAKTTGDEVARVEDRIVQEL